MQCILQYRFYIMYIISFKAIVIVCKSSANKVRLEMMRVLGNVDEGGIKSDSTRQVMICTTTIILMGCLMRRRAVVAVAVAVVGGDGR